MEDEMRGRVTVGVASVVLLLGACGSDADEGSSGSGNDAETTTVRIGLNETLSGDGSPNGGPPGAGVQMAVRDINEAGGFVVDGVTYTIDLVEIDNRGLPAEAVAGMTGLAEDGVKFVFGPTLSSLAGQTEPIAVENGILNISPAAAWVQQGFLSDPERPYLFGTQVPLNVTAAAAAEAVKDLGAKKVGMLNVDDAVTEANVSALIDALEALDMDVIDVRFTPNTTDYTPYLTRLKSEDIDVLYYYYPSSLAAEILGLAVELDVAKLGYAATNTNADPAMAKEWDLPFISTLALPSVNYPISERQETYSKDIREFNSNLGSTADFSYYTYDFVGMLAAAMSAAGTVDDVEAIAEALRELEYEGVAGKMCFMEEMRAASLDRTQFIVKDGNIEQKTLPADCG